MSSTINRQLIALAIAPAVLVVAIGGLSFYATHSFQVASADVEDSHRAIGTIDRVLDDMQDAETGERGYLLTGDPSYLGPYNDALARLNPDLQDLRTHVATDRLQMQRFQQLEVHVDNRLNVLASEIDARRTGGPEAAANDVSTDSGKAEMDAVRGLIADMQVTQQAVVDQRSADRDATARNQLIVVGVLVALEVALLTAFFIAVRRWLLERQSRETQAVALAEAQYRAVGDAIPFGVWASGPQGNITYISPEMLAFVGQTFEEYRTDGWRRVSPPGQVEEISRTWRQALATKQPYNYTRQVTGVDGTVRDILGRAVPVMDLDGTVVGYAGINLDVTEQSRAEEALRFSEDRYRTLTESMPALIATTSGDGVVQYHNSMWAQYTGMTADALAGDGWAGIVHPDDLPYVRATWEDVQRNPRHFEFDYRVRRHDGGYYWHHDVTTPVFDPSGRVGMWISVDVEIDERKRNEEAIEAQSKAKDDFLGMVSHELRTPLTIIVGNARALGRLSSMSKAEQASVIGDIAGESERLQRLIENMLTLSRVERGATGEIEPILLQRALPGMATNHAGHRPLTLSIDEELPPAAADAGYIDQILQNLISNARKYSPDGSPIEVRAWRRNDCAAVAVLDRGAGIPEHELARVFEPFFRSQATAANAGGIGLGLAVCKRLVDVLGGRMWARCRKDGGTEIGFLLPLYGYEEGASCALEELATV